MALITANQFKPMDFARYHPGGSLGRKLLTRVADVMHSPAPIVSPASSFQDCLLMMTQSRLGLAMVMDGNELVGIVTDGDLRRALLKNNQVIHASVTEFMTLNPTPFQRIAACRSLKLTCWRTKSVPWRWSTIAGLLLASSRFLTAIP